MSMNKISLHLTHTPVLRAVVMLSCSVLLTILVAALWLPSYLNKERYNVEIYKLNEEIRVFQSKIANAKALQRNRRALTDVTERLSQRVSQSILIEKLNKIVSMAGVVLNDQAFRETAMINNVNIFKQSLVISGSYREIRNFIAQLSNSMPGLNVVSQITLNKDTDSLISAHIELNSYSTKTE